MNSTPPIFHGRSGKLIDNGAGQDLATAVSGLDIFFLDHHITLLFRALRPQS
jgi:hypothetical protein